MQEILGLPSASTVSEWDKSEKFYPGFNTHFVSQAAKTYEGQLVVECSDEARVRR